MIYVFTGIEPMRKKYKENLAGKDDEKLIQDSADRLHNYNGVYEIVDHNIYINLGIIFEDYSINLIEKIIEVVTHETYHYIFHKEFGIAISEHDFERYNYVGTIHHLLMKQLGCNNNVKRDSQINKDKFRRCKHE